MQAWWMRVFSSAYGSSVGLIAGAAGWPRVGWALGDGGAVAAAVAVAVPWR